MLEQVNGGCGVGNILERSRFSEMCTIVAELQKMGLPRRFECGNCRHHWHCHFPSSAPVTSLSKRLPMTKVLLGLVHKVIQAANITDVKLYFKPEADTAHYDAANKKHSGSVSA